MCARIGIVSGGGLAAALRRHYPRPVLLALVLTLFAANTANIGADLAAVASGVDLLTGLPAGIVIVPGALLIAVSEILIPYRVFATYLKLLTLVLVAYIVDAFLARPDWVEALRRTFVPDIRLTGAYLTTIVAIFGTTISPYLFFWQTSEEVEELHAHRRATGGDPDIRRASLDVDFGMLLANVVFYFIVLTTAATLHPSGKTDIETARDAAEALRPLAGDAATTLFALGFIATGLLSIPVLAGSAAYAVAEVFDWSEGLEQKPRQAPQFYLVIGVSTIVGLAFALSGLGAIRALFVSAVLNGVASPLLILAILVVSNDRKILGRHTNSGLSNLLGGAAFLLMALAALAMAVTFVVGQV